MQKKKKKSKPANPAPLRVRYSLAGYPRGTYARVAAELGKSRTHVHSVAQGTRVSRAVSDALAKHLKRPKMDFGKGGAE